MVAEYQASSEAQGDQLTNTNKEDKDNSTPTSTPTTKPTTTPTTHPLQEEDNKVDMIGVEYQHLVVVVGSMVRTSLLGLIILIITNKEHHLVVVP
jgi:hypothetical protein